ncbi:MAG: NifB/NifX family molybdenum-iron cluster-binding protein [Thermoplasmata archaeon]|nr:NifB/NifX family molybdenum-iron cluster-binding protein [Thermoplasmata archaeon]
MDEKIKIAIPTNAPGGLKSEMSGHFGHADNFTLVDIQGKSIAGTTVLENPPHSQGGCMAPVMLLKNNGVQAIIVGGLGQRPLMGFQQAGIQVIAGATGNVESLIQAYLDGKLSQAGDDVVCGHSKDGGCEH